MIYRIFRLLVLALFLSEGIIYAEEITVATGQTFIDDVFNPAKAALQEKGFIVRIDFSNPAEALTRVDRKIAILGGASLLKEDWIKVTEQAGNQLNDKNSLIFYKIMEEQSIVVVNRSNSLTSLSTEQLKDIFSGKIKNWNEVGGTDTPIIVVWPTSPSGGTLIFSKEILKGAEVTEEVLEVSNIGEVCDAVTANTEAVGIINNGESENKCKKIDAPKLLRPLTLVSKGKLPTSAQKLVDFLMQEGKRYYLK